MKIIVTGSTGQLGSAVMREINKHDDMIAVGLNSIVNIVNGDLIKKVICSTHPDVIIHCAAYTAVDKAEEEEYEAYKVNVVGTRNIAEAAKECGAKLVYISTDYVYGERDDTIRSSRLNPLNVYGWTKLVGERMVRNRIDNHFIIRTSWLFGIRGRNFPKFIVNSFNGNPAATARVVNDQIGRPTYADDLARLIIDMIQTDNYGTYDVCNEGEDVSWYEYALEICKQWGFINKIEPITSEEYNSKAKRQKDSRLNTAKLCAYGFTPLPNWKSALTRYWEVMFDDNNV